MKRHLIVPLIAALSIAGVALAQSTTPSSDSGTKASDGDRHWHWHHHHMGMWHHADPLANLAKPLTADAVKQALNDWFARRPQVKSVTESGPNVLLVEIVDPDGKVHKFELNETTGARRPSW